MPWPPDTGAGCSDGPTWPFCIYTEFRNIPRYLHMLQMARKQPESLLDLHDLFRKVWEGRDKSLDPPRKAELGPGPLLAHSEDILHPENLVTASRNFPTQATVSLAKLEAARLLRQGRTQDAITLLLTNQAVTFQHLVNMQYYKARAAVAKAKPEGEENVEEGKEETDEKDRLKFTSIENTDITKMLAELPGSWTAEVNMMYLWV